VAAAGFAWKNSQRPKHWVSLGSASGESRAMESPDKDEIEAIVNAIKRAIVERG